MGVLKQGYMNIPDYQWEFPLSAFKVDQQVRQSKVQDMLTDVRRMREEDYSMRKKQQKN